ncbi:hypothetical protein JCM18694_30210 [Prolixibacter denitrificans]|nr:hypothetical protein JCM18694_30210 [Prolixibacter denitrificans]
MAIHELPNPQGTYSQYFIIPLSGEGQELNKVKSFIQQNYFRRNIRFILTAVDSTADLDSELGAWATHSPNIYIDSANQLGPDGRADGISGPVLFSLDDNQVSQVRLQGNENPSKIDEVLRELAEEPFIKVDLKGYLDGKYQKVEVQSDSLFSQIKRIQLKTTGGYAIGTLMDMKVCSRYYFLLDNQMNIFRFDKEGNLLRKIGTKGKGPREYSNLYQFDIDTVHSRVFLLDAFSKKIIVHHFDGEYLKTIDLPYIPAAFSYMENMSFMLSVPDYNQPDGEKFALMKVDEKGNIINRYLPVSAPKERRSSPDFFNMPLMKNIGDGRLLYWPLQTNEEYIITPDGQKLSYCRFEEGNLQVPGYIAENVKLMEANMNKYIFQLYARQSNRFLFINFFYQMNNYGLVYDKKKELFYEASKGKRQPQIKGVDGNPDFWPAFSSGNKLYSIDYQEDTTWLIAAETIN